MELTLVKHFEDQDGLAFQIRFQHKPRSKATFSKGPSINDVTLLEGKGYQGFCDNGTKACT